MQHGIICRLPLPFCLALNKALGDRIVSCLVAEGMAGRRCVDKQTADINK